MSTVNLIVKVCVIIITGYAKNIELLVLIFQENLKNTGNATKNIGSLASILLVLVKQKECKDVLMLLL